MSSEGRRTHGQRGRARQREPIWLRAAGGAGRRRPALSAESIARAALAAADAHGIEAVSMRSIAAALGVGTMTLYGYVRSKDDLLDLMYDEVAAEQLVHDLPEQWRDALREIARRTLAGLRRHPWLLATMGGRSFGSPNMLRHIEQSAAAVAGLDADPETKTLFLMVVDDYALGYAAREAVFARLDTAVLEHAAFGPYLQRLLASGQFPHLERLMSGRLRLPDRSGHFEQGLELLLDGMEAHLARLRANGERPPAIQPVDCSP